MIPPNDEPPPNEKKLRIAPFALHSARGLIRDQHTRRMTMFVIVILALVMLFLGSTVLAPALDAKLRPGWFILYWAICVWVTLTAVLLAMFDLLMVRARGRGEKRRLQDDLAEDDDVA
jgi:protein-S-isoprenylcysteine O-methyltransferase Ste14